MTFCLYFSAAYLIGSINFSILLFKILKREDPRMQFSGNPGATNIYRQAGIGWAIIVFMLDTGRAVVISIASLYGLSPSEVPWVGLALILGNRYPVFHQFKGGKGVANYLGFTAAITPVGALIAALAWVIVYRIIHIPFIASFFMIFFLSGATIAKWPDAPIAILGAALTFFLIINNHRQNILEYRRKK